MNEEKKRCPFLKHTYVKNGLTSGEGYPIEVETWEEFEDCVGEECVAFNPYMSIKCSLCN